MDEDLPYTNDEIPYTDDVPYEAQLPDTAVQRDGASLKNRIGKRIYLLEDSTSKKRKLTAVDDNLEDPDAQGGQADADLPYRPNALLLQGPPISQIPTARIFAYATHFDAHPIGLEWVDDQTCVLVFGSRRSALHAWSMLRRRSQQGIHDSDHPSVSTAIEVEIDFDEAFHPVHPLPIALYPIDERINSVLGNKKSNALKEAMQIRWARPTDVKERGARFKSDFYKRHGESAGKEGLPGFSQDESKDGNKRRKRNDEDVRRQLDAELDVFLVDDEEVPPKNYDIQVDVKRRKDRSRDEDEKRRLLDLELESFLEGGNLPVPHPEPAQPDQEFDLGTSVPQGMSLLERTGRSGRFRSQSPRRRDRQTRPLPQRGHRGDKDNIARRYETDEDGRWLHNAEITQRRRRNVYDEATFGMRAWGGEQSRRPKRKTQEELDQELDQLWQHTT